MDRFGSHRALAHRPVKLNPILQQLSQAQILILRRCRSRPVTRPPRLQAASSVTFLARASWATGAFRLNMPFLNSALTLSGSIFFGR